MLTILIFTYNRHYALDRYLVFLEKLSVKFNLIILDSSSNNKTKELLKEKKFNLKIKYKKFNSKIFYTNKILKGLKYVKTKYVILNPDDDFYIPKVIKKCVNFLEKNKDYFSARGRSYNYDFYHNLENFGFKISKCGHEESVNNDEAFLRIRNYNISRGSNSPLYAVHRTKHLKKIYKITNKANSSWQLSEIIPCYISLFFGKMKMINNIYSIRHPNNDMPLSLKKLLKCYSKKNIQKAVNVLYDEFKKKKIDKNFLYNNFLEFKSYQAKKIKSFKILKFRNYKKYSLYRIMRFTLNKFYWLLLLIFCIKNFKELMLVKRLVLNINISILTTTSRIR